MKKSFWSLWLVGLFCLAACGSEGDGKAPEKDAPRLESEMKETEPSVSEPQFPPLSPEEQKKAVAIVDYYNLANSLLAEEPYTLPETCRVAAREYLQSWRLKTIPRIARGTLDTAAKRLEPPLEVFPEQEREQFARYILDMGRALEEVLKEYRQLEKYVKDNSIIDDGAGGNEIIATLDAAHRNFLVARDDFLKRAEELSAPAEDALLHGHPLRRQIALAREIFLLCRRCATLLGEEQPDKTALGLLGEELGHVLNEAGKPPFRGSPGLERQYRVFLREVERFAEVLASGLAGNFDAVTRRSMNEAISAGRAAYNNFAMTANER
ncbi:MAG: hypothetical protein LBC94_09345 [Desulfovibrio sp.]|jgi:hypothetical protein|nr:hypothetical protein [Desulfovibrio sp.]